MKKINIGHEIMDGIKEISSWKSGNKKLKVVNVKLRDSVPFIIADYVDCPIALARIKAGITKDKLARLMKVTSGYISKIEKQNKI